MHTILKGVICLYLLMIVLTVTPVWAQQDTQNSYVRPNNINVIRTALRFKAFNLDKDAVLDEYIRLLYCDYYQKYYNDDFKWAALRRDVRLATKSTRDRFPTRYEVITTTPYGRFDPIRSGFHPIDNGKFRNIAVIDLLNIEGSSCGSVNPVNIPTRYLLRLNEPIQINTVPVSSELAQIILDRLTERRQRLINSNIDPRQFHVRIRLNITSLAGRDSDDPGKVVFRAQVESVSFFEDQKLRNLVWEWTQPAE